MPRLRILILLAGDSFLIFGTYLLVLILLGAPSGLFERELELPVALEYFLFENFGLPRLLVITTSLLLGMYLLGLYEHIRIESRRRLVEDLALILGVAFLLQSLLAYGRLPLGMPRWVMLAGSVLLVINMLIWRMIYNYGLLRLIGKQKILFWGDSPVARQIAAHIQAFPEKGFEVIGVVGITLMDPADPFPDVPLIPLGEDIFDRVLALDPDRVVVSGMLSANQANVTKPLLELSMMGVNVESLGDLYELLQQRVSLELLTLNQLIFSRDLRPATWKFVAQDLYGRCIALIGITLTWPLMLLTAIAVRSDSPGPALLRQRRVGLNGKTFEILKFRSMYIDGDQRFGTIRASHEDPRITRVGRFIRVTRLDELPQFFNVLRGDMTLVGPRPEMPVYVEKLSREIPLYPQRMRVKPGITGWAQLHHVPEVGLAETRRKIEFDLYYIKNLSPLFDFIIMFHTIRTLIHRTGAR